MRAWNFRGGWADPLKMLWICERPEPIPVFNDDVGIVFAVVADFGILLCAHPSCPDGQRSPWLRAVEFNKIVVVDGHAAVAVAGPAQASEGEKTDLVEASVGCVSGNPDAGLAAVHINRMLDENKGDLLKFVRANPNIGPLPHPLLERPVVTCVINVGMGASQPEARRTILSDDGFVSDYLIERPGFAVGPFSCMAGLNRTLDIAAHQTDAESAGVVVATALRAHAERRVSAGSTTAVCVHIDVHGTLRTWEVH